MQVFVQILTDKTISLEVEDNHTIKDVKSKVHHTEGIPPEQQRLMFPQKELYRGNVSELEETFTLSDYHILRKRILYT